MFGDMDYLVQHAARGRASQDKMTALKAKLADKDNQAVLKKTAKDGNAIAALFDAYFCLNYFSDMSPESEGKEDLYDTKERLRKVIKKQAKDPENAFARYAYELGKLTGTMGFIIDRSFQISDSVSSDSDDSDSDDSNLG